MTIVYAALFYIFLKFFKKAQIYSAFVIDFNNFHQNLIAFFYYVGDFFDARFGQFRDVNHAVFIGGKFDKCADFYYSYDFSFIDFAGFDILDNRHDYGACFIDHIQVMRRDGYSAVVIDIDFDACFVDNLVDYLTALADNISDLIGINHKGRNLGRPLGELKSEAKRS